MQTYNFMNESVDVYQNGARGFPSLDNPVDVTGSRGQEQAVVRRYTNPLPTTQPVASPATMPLNRPTSMPVASSSIPQVLEQTKPTLQTVDENAIREETKKRMQASIDAIEANYAALRGQEQVAGEDRLGQTRAINARSGLMGSDFGQSNTIKTQQFNSQQMQALEAQKQAQLQSVLLNIEDRASAEIERKKKEALGQYERDQEEFYRKQEEARNDIMNYAKSGGMLGNMTPAQRMALQRQAGYEGNDIGFESLFNANLPKPAQIKYTYETRKDGSIIRFGDNGEIKTFPAMLSPEVDAHFINADNGDILYVDKNDPTNDDGSPKYHSLGNYAKPGASGQGDGLLSIDEASDLGVPYGTTKAQAMGIIPGSTEVVQKAQNSVSEIQAAIGLIDTLKTHKGLDGATGFIGGRINIGGNSRDFKAKYDQLVAMLQLGNIDKLRGTGPITEREQEVLRNAATSMDVLGDKDKLTKEMDKLRTVLEQRLQAQNNLVNSYSQSTINEFESQYGVADFSTLMKDLLDQGFTFDEAKEAIDAELGGSSGFNQAGKPQVSKGMRTDRHLNPTAFTTDIAKMAGLKLGVDYEIGDPFPNNPNLKTARLLKDPVATTIKVIDNIGFYTQSGKPRWSYVANIPEANKWKSLSYNQKKAVIGKMYSHEGGSQLLNYFA